MRPSIQVHDRQDLGWPDNKPLISFLIPAYNMARNLDTCLNSLLSNPTTELEIIVIDDGSTDETGKLVEGYRAQYPQIVRYVHQDNKGHGGAVNTGISLAQGLYVKVIDADDWVDTDSLSLVLDRLRTQAAISHPVDMVVTNYVYEKEGRHHKRVINFRNVMVPNRILGWNQLGRFGMTQYMIMHALIFRTQVLRTASTCLPEHTYYVDFIYSYQPLPYVTSLLYLDTNFYRYHTGREGQSVQTSAMISRVDQLLLVNGLMVRYTPEPGQVPRGLYRYMIHYLAINCVITSVFLVLSKRPSNYANKKMLWERLKYTSPAIYHDVRSTLLCRLINMPDRPGRIAIRIGYRVAEAAVGFN